MENETEIKTDDELKKIQGIEEGETILRVTKNPNESLNTFIRGNGDEVFKAISGMVLSILNSGFDVSLLLAAVGVGIELHKKGKKGRIG